MTSTDQLVEFREIERRFLLDHVPEDVLASPSVLIEQGYIAGHPVTVRLRSIESEGVFLTVKRGNLPDREEREVQLTQEQFEVLWPVTAGWRLEKRRYRVAWAEHVIEVDVFSGRHTGLVIAEVEFRSNSAADQFTPPPWFGREITGEKNFSNAKLSEPTGR
ncbi:MAG: CYTH domain-containing protein [Chthoniobacterales bacterium]